MANIIFDSSKLKIMDFLERLSSYAGFRADYADEMWKKFSSHPEIFQEFVYYVDHHEILGQMEIEGYNLLDCYVWQRQNYIFRYLDKGKIENNCNEETMVLLAFEFFMNLQDNPAEYRKKLEEDLGRDKFK